MKWRVYMIRFLKSTLFPSNINSIITNLSNPHMSKIEELNIRIAALEEENKKSAVAVKEITEYLSQMTIIITSMAADFVALTDALQEQAPDEDLLSKYLTPDDDGYIH